MDEAYSRPELYWGSMPTRTCRLLLDHLPPSEAQGKVLMDLGCGEGRDAIAYSRHGFRVVGLDVSQPGLEKAQRWAREEELELQTVHASILDFRLEQPVDVLSSSGTLHYLPPQVQEEVFGNYKQLTRVGGLQVFSVFVKKPFIAPAPNGRPDEHSFRSGELLGYYWDWEIVSFTEVIFDCISSGVPHQHAMDIMLARKVVA
jgi:tellurite methyltransferase